MKLLRETEEVLCDYDIIRAIFKKIIVRFIKKIINKVVMRL